MTYPKRDWTKYSSVWEGRMSGKTFTRLGEEFNLSRERCRQMVNQYERELSREEDWSDGLPARIGHALKHGGYKNRRSVDKASFEDLFNVVGIGKKGISEINRWLDLTKRFGVV